MRKILTILFLLPFIVNAQFGQPKFTSTSITPPPPPPGGTVNIVMAAINPLTDFQRRGGNEVWQFNSGSQIVSGAQTPLNGYLRLTWLDCESNTTAGDYSKLWTGRFRSRVIQYLNAGQTFSFGIMQRYPEVCSSGGYNSGEFYDGACSSYPEYVHDLMQGNADPDYNDFNDGTTWIEAANNPQWQTRWAALHQNIMNWLDTASYTPASGPFAGRTIIFKNALTYVDVRGCGSYGEWHNCCLDNGYDLICNWPGVVMSGGCFGTITDYGTYATPQTMKNIIDAQIEAYDDYPCVIIINVLDGNRFGNTKIIPEVGIYALTVRNSFGGLGLRRDQWGDNESYYSSILQNNTMSFNGIIARDTILNIYKRNYFCGEPPGYNNGGSTLRNGVFMGWLPDQAQTLHAYSVGNGNYGGNAPTNQSSRDSVLKAFRLMGARIYVSGGTMTQTLQAGSSFNVTLGMQNIGLATEWRGWTTQIILKNSGGTTVFTGTHGFNVRGFLPTSSQTDFSTNFTLSGAVPGTGYSLYVKIIDPLGVVDPYSLGNTGRDGDGAYLVRSGITVI